MAQTPGKRTANDEEFDAAITIWVLEHVQKPEMILSEINRVLKPGGRILLHEVDNDI